MAWPGLLAQGRQGEKQLIHGTFLEEIVHLVEHPFLACHLLQAFARVKRDVVISGQPFADGKRAASELSGYRDYHRMVFKTVANVTIFVGMTRIQRVEMINRDL